MIIGYFADFITTEGALLTRNLHANLYTHAQAVAKSLAKENHWKVDNVYRA